MFWEGFGRGAGGVEKCRKIVIFKNVWEYFSRVGGIKIRGLGILLDKKIEKSKNQVLPFFCSYFLYIQTPDQPQSGLYVTRPASSF